MVITYIWYIFIYIMLFNTFLIFHVLVIVGYFYFQQGVVILYHNVANASCKLQKLFILHQTRVFSALHCPCQVNLKYS